MKNLSIVLNIVLLIAVAILFVLHFSGKGSIGGGAETADDSLSVDLKDLSIAYVNRDSVLSNYELFKKLSKDLETKEKQADQNLQSRAQGLQREVQEFQSTAGNLTINQARALEESLRQKQQNLYMYEQSLTQQLMNESNQMTAQLNDKLNDFLERYGKEHDLKLVVSYTKRGDILYAHDAMDITQPVIKGLNSEYQAEQSGTAANKETAKADTTKTK